MDELIQNLITKLTQFISPQDSLIYSDFFNYVNSLQEKIIDFFRFSSLKYVPIFFSGMIKAILNEASSEEKRRRFNAAICITSLINLFPFDDCVLQFRPIIEKLLIPGYRPILKIGAKVLGKLARISGIERDRLLREIVYAEKNKLISKESKDVRYTAAYILKQISLESPEILFAMGTSFTEIITINFQSGDVGICELLIKVLRNLFNSEASQVGKSFLTELHELLITATTKNFFEASNSNDLIINFQLLLLLLKIKPYIPKKTAELLIFPQCQKYLKSSNFDIVSYSIRTIVKLKKINVADVKHDCFDKMYDICSSILLQQNSYASDYYGKADVLFSKIIDAFPNFIEGKASKILHLVEELCKKSVGNSPDIAFNIIISVVESLPIQSNITKFLSIVPHILSLTAVTIPLHNIIIVLNKTRPKWASNFLFFKNQIIHITQQELTAPSSKTERVMISLLTLLNTPISSFIDAVELNALVLKLSSSKDTQVRENIAGVSIHLFEAFPNKIPLGTIKRLVQLALDDPIRSVRICSIRAFTPITYRFISQPDVFPLFCRFVYDESIEVRKQTLNIFRSLKVVTGTILRNLILSSLKQMNLDFKIILPEAMPIWIIFPNIIQAAEPWIHIYAISIFERLVSILNKRFEYNRYQEETLFHMDSIIYQDIDESLIKSMTKLHILCPDIIPIKTILAVFCKILEQPFHPWTKIHVLKSLKNLALTDYLLDSTPQIIPVLLNIIHHHDSLKLVTKTLKVIGSIGFSEVKNTNFSFPLIFKSSFKNLIQFKHFFMSVYLKYLNNQFQCVNIESTRAVIVKIITEIYKLEPALIPQYIESFLNIYLDFLKESTSEYLEQFFDYLTEIIKVSGHLINQYSSRIFENVYKNWIGNGNKYTECISKVIKAMVIATRGKCETILNLIVTESFFIIKQSKIINNASNFVGEIFLLLNEISKYSPSYLLTIVSGVIDCILTSNPVYIQDYSLDTIEYIIKFCQSTNVLSTIKRCLNILLTRPQMRWRERAKQLFLLIENNCSVINIDNETSTLPLMQSTSTQSFTESNEFINQIIKFNKISKNTNEIDLWFNDLMKISLIYSPSDIIRTMAELSQLPKFTFEFSFLQIWLTCDLDKHQLISSVINSIFSSKYTSNITIKEFINLVEFTVLCEIDLNIDIEVLVKRCIDIKLYAKALFFLETYSLFNKSNEMNENKIKNLVKLNEIVGRHHESRAIAMQYKDKIHYSVWIQLKEWNLALQQIESNPYDNKLLTQKIICLAALDEWKTILQYETKFSQQSLADQSCLAKYFWTAEVYSGNKERALLYLDYTECYTVEDCIQKAILFIKLNKLESARDAIHIGWRYLGSGVIAVEKTNKLKLQKHLFQAEQLRELTDVIKIIQNPSIFEEYKKAWEYRLQFLNNNPFDQKELLKIRSLCPDITEIDEFAYRILSSSTKSKYSMVSNLAYLFFPDPNDEKAKYAQIRLLPPDQGLPKAFELVKDVKNTKLKSRINNYIGEILFNISKNKDDLKKSLKYLQAADKNLSRMADCFIILSFIENSQEYSLYAAEALRRILKIKPSSLRLHQLLSLATSFCHHEKTINHIKETFEDLDPKLFLTISHISLMLFSHSNPILLQIAHHIVKAISTEYPQSVFYDLINNHELSDVDSMIAIIQRDNPVIFSQLTMISSKLSMISNTYFEQWISALNESLDLARNGELDSAKQKLILMKPTLSNINASKYDSEFIHYYKNEILDIINSETYEIEDIRYLLNLLTKKQESTRIIPLVSFDEQLARKTNWSISMLGLSGIEEDVKINRFYHSVMRIDNGFRISILGDNGKKFNYHLIHENYQTVTTKQSEEMLNLINSIYNSHELVQRSIIELSSNSVLIELLKGHIQLYNLVSMYNKSKEDVVEPNDLRMIDEYDYSSLKQKIKKIEEYQQEIDKNDLARAILVSSKNSMNWLNRTSEFSKSMGFLSSISYLFGSVDTSPSAILFDKVSGSVTFTKFAVSGNEEPVPFRMTKMIETTFGTCGYNGPFKETLQSSLNTIKNFSKALGMCLYFFVGKAPFLKTEIPSQLLSNFVAFNSGNPELDKLYQRISCGDNLLEDLVDELIQNAKFIENQAQMPGYWLPWW